MCEIKQNGERVAMADECSGLYVLRQPERVCAVTASQHKPNCIHNLHRIFGHRNPDAIRTMCVDGLKIAKCGIKQQCDVCLKAKQTRLPFPKSSGTSRNVLDLVHTDVCGPMQTISPSGKRYMLTFIDDFSRYTVVYLLREKSEVEERIREYLAMVTNKFSTKPKVIRSGRGGEYMGFRVTSFLKSQGVQI